jgi:hypothetical protein
MQEEHVRMHAYNVCANCIVVVFMIFVIVRINGLFEPVSARLLSSVPDDVLLSLTEGETKTIKT